MLSEKPKLLRPIASGLGGPFGKESSTNNLELKQFSLYSQENVDLTSLQANNKKSMSSQNQRAAIQPQISVIPRALVIQEKLLTLFKDNIIPDQNDVRKTLDSIYKIFKDTENVTIQNSIKNKLLAQAMKELIYEKDYKRRATGSKLTKKEMYQWILNLTNEVAGVYQKAKWNVDEDITANPRNFQYTYFFEKYITYMLDFDKYEIIYRSVDKIADTLINSIMEEMLLNQTIDQQDVNRIRTTFIIQFRKWISDFNIVKEFKVNIADPEQQLDALPEQMDDAEDAFSTFIQDLVDSIHDAIKSQEE